MLQVWNRRGEETSRVKRWAAEQGRQAGRLAGREGKGWLAGRLAGGRLGTIDLRCNGGEVEDA